MTTSVAVRAFIFGFIGVTTVDGTIRRSAGGIVSRLGGNLWEEFWPDVRRGVFKK